MPFQDFKNDRLSVIRPSLPPVILTCDFILPVLSARVVREVRLHSFPGQNWYGFQASWFAKAKSLASKVGTEPGRPIWVLSPLVAKKKFPLVDAFEVKILWPCQNQLFFLI